MRLRFILQAAVLVTLLCAYSASSFPRRVLVEYFTNHTIRYCAEAAPIVNHFIDQHEDDISVVVYHEVSDPFYNSAPIGHRHRFDYYAVGATPHLRLDGNRPVNPSNPDAIENVFLERVDVDSPLRIEVFAYLRENNSIGVVSTVETGDLPLGAGQRIFFALTTKQWSYFTGDNGQGGWRHDLVGFSEHTWYEYNGPIRMERNSKNQYRASFVYPDELGGLNETGDNLNVIAFVQDTESYMVTQSAITTGFEDPSFYAGLLNAYPADAMGHLVNPSDTIEYSYIVEMIGDDNILRLEVDDRDLPEGWSFTFETNEGWHDGSIIDTVEQWEQYRYGIHLVTGNDGGESGRGRLIVSYESNPDYAQFIDLYAATACPLVVVNDDDYARYGRIYREAVETACENDVDERSPYIIWPNDDYVLQTNIIPESVELLFWYTGDGGWLRGNQVDGFRGLLRQGKSLVISSQSMFDYLDSPEFLDTVGVEFVQRLDDITLVSGVDGDPISEGLNFSISGGNGADNLHRPAGLRPVQGGVACMRYDNGSVAAVRKETEGYQALVLGFPFESISDREHRAELMRRILENYTTLLEVDETSSERPPGVFRLEQNHPNPFNSSTVLAFYLPERVRVRLAVYDILGREVAEPAGGILSRGLHRVAWNPGNIAAGIYFARLEINGEQPGRAKGMLIRKMVLVH